MTSRAIAPVEPELLVGIGAVERDTGISKDTLRMWEKRYGFPKPIRDCFGERAYAREAVDRLRTIKRLIEAGHRPGKIVGQGAQELDALRGAAGSAGVARAAPAELTAYLDMVRTHQVDELRRAMGRALVRGGLGQFVLQVAAPLTSAVGEALMRDDLRVFEERLYTEVMQTALRLAIAGVPQQSGTPRILLTTFPHEQHGLGLLMAEAILVLEDAHCISLGTQTPVGEIALGVASQRADIVGLSFSTTYPLAQAIDGLENLRKRLPPEIDIWAGSDSQALGRRRPNGVRAIKHLQDLQNAVAQWRIVRDDSGR